MEYQQLQSVLNCPVGREIFEAFAEKQLLLESLQLIDMVALLKTVTDPEQIKEIAVKIFNRFIQPSSVDAVSLEANTVNEIATQVQKGNFSVAMFDEAAQEAFSFLINILPVFSETPEYIEWSKKKQKDTAPPITNAHSDSSIHGGEKYRKVLGEEAGVEDRKAKDSKLRNISSLVVRNVKKGTNNIKKSFKDRERHSRERAGHSHSDERKREREKNPDKDKTQKTVEKTQSSTEAMNSNSTGELYPADESTGPAPTMAALNSMLGNLTVKGYMEYTGFEVFREKEEDKPPAQQPEEDFAYEEKGEDGSGEDMMDFLFGGGQLDDDEMNMM
eukprot:CAMPEP_0177657842 /NCGR_PEP_ID=MMETSP0447-20121125/16448_1 /TAXON_ID=0 /ORGANISM="Stygamoeba regulata, Strain BSH-02190019" /LENGTH=330 /DNA_ID=CAMNT_0019162319 /DNA_START=150 /DNA_END=1139 /DNA_ORIENTATION=-